MITIIITMIKFNNETCFYVISKSSEKNKHIKYFTHNKERNKIGKEDLLIQFFTHWKKLKTTKDFLAETLSNTSSKWLLCTFYVPEISHRSFFTIFWLFIYFFFLLDKAIILLACKDPTVSGIFWATGFQYLLHTHSVSFSHSRSTIANVTHTTYPRVIP